MDLLRQNPDLLAGQEQDHLIKNLTLIMAINLTTIMAINLTIHMVINIVITFGG
jgi:hypothetical protein